VEPLFAAKVNNNESSLLDSAQLKSLMQLGLQSAAVSSSVFSLYLKLPLHLPAARQLLWYQLPEIWVTDYP